MLLVIPSVLSLGMFGSPTIGSYTNPKTENMCYDLSLVPVESGTNGGQQVIDYFRTVFEADWIRGSSYDHIVDDIGFPQSRDLYGSGYNPFPSQLLSNQTMTITPILSPDNAEENIIQLINSANATLYIEQMYIYTFLF